MNYADKTGEALAGSVAANYHIPSGEGITALVGALSAALGASVARVTAEHCQTEVLDDMLRISTTRLDESRKQLLISAANNSKIYIDAAEALREKSSNPVNFASADAALQAAMDASMQVFDSCSGVAHELCLMWERTGFEYSRLTELGCAAHLCKASMECAVINIYACYWKMHDRKAADGWIKPVRAKVKEHMKVVERICFLSMKEAECLEGL